MVNENKNDLETHLFLWLALLVQADAERERLVGVVHLEGVGDHAKQWRVSRRGRPSRHRRGYATAVRPGWDRAAGTAVLGAAGRLQRQHFEFAKNRRFFFFGT